MNWMNERTGPQWKHGWSSQTLASISTPSLHLLVIFVIVIFLLSSSQPADYRADARTSSSLLFVPLLMVVISGAGYFMLQGGLNMHLPQLRFRHQQQPIVHRQRTPHFSSFAH